MNEIKSGPILIVEDMPNILELLDVTLRFKGYPTMTARNGQEALSCMNKELPALVVTDILMPKLDGYALVHQLRKNPKTRSIPIIFLTATYVTPEDKVFGISLGAVRYLEKPVDTEDFLFTVAEVLNSEQTGASKPLGDQDFYRGYRRRLEYKLRHKLAQIQRTRNLLATLPENQQQAFQTLLSDVCKQRDEIQKELNEIHQLLAN